MNKQEKESQANAFIKKLEMLNPVDLARLKRNAGRSLAEARGVNMLVYRLLPLNISSDHTEMYFLVATLYPLANGGGSGNFGASLRRAQSITNRKGIDRRIEALLDAEGAQLSFRIRQAIHFLHSNRVSVNWYQLLEDLLHWNHPERFVQQSWAREYYAVSEKNQP